MLSVLFMIRLHIHDLMVTRFKIDNQSFITKEVLSFRMNILKCFYPPPSTFVLKRSLGINIMVLIVSFLKQDHLIDYK